MKEKIKRYLINPILFYIVGILFSFFQITGYILATKKTIAWNVAQIVGISLVSIICGVFIGYIVYLLAKNNSVEGMEHKRLIEKCSEKNKRVSGRLRYLVG